MKRIITIITFILLLPILVYTFYELNNLSENEKHLENIYSEQLNTIIFSVNQNVDDVLQSWSAKISDIYQSQDSSFTNIEMQKFCKSLESENHGVKMCTVEHIGRYILSNFEDDLIDMLSEVNDIKDKQIIALSLSQLGSLKSILAIKDSQKNSTNIKYINFVSELLENFNEYDKLRSEYFEALVVNLLDTK